MKILKYNYSLLLSFKVKNKFVFVSFLYRAYINFGGLREATRMLPIQNTILAHYGIHVANWSVLTDY